MPRVILITGTFPIYKNGHKTGKTEFVVSHGVNEETGRNVILPCEHPAMLGAKFDTQLQEWVLED